MPAFFQEVGAVHGCLDLEHEPQLRFHGRGFGELQHRRVGNACGHWVTVVEVSDHLPSGVVPLTSMGIGQIHLQGHVLQGLVLRVEEVSKVLAVPLPQLRLRHPGRTQCPKLCGLAEQLEAAGASAFGLDHQIAAHLQRRRGGQVEGQIRLAAQDGRILTAGLPEGVADLHTARNQKALDVGFIADVGSALLVIRQFPGGQMPSRLSWHIGDENIRDDQVNLVECVG
mmetsp:Transcript_53626/g.128249  ORF Transcript_53626/g.128249 Transcript_53626/m.128249 type:complete len:227 (-) Transcript_53626:2578-3258(-)